MLYWMWFIGLAAVGWFFAFRQRGNSSARLLSWLAMLFALLISWDGIGARVFGWLDGVVPQVGTGIHTLTVMVLSGLLCVVWIVHPLLVSGQIAASNDTRSSQDPESK